MDENVLNRLAEVYTRIENWRASVGVKNELDTPVMLLDFEFLRACIDGMMGQEFRKKVEAKLVFRKVIWK